MRGDRLTRLALCAGIAAPFLYYGNQAVAAPFFPGFSFVGSTASELGSGLSRYPALFNSGPILQGVVGLFAVLGFLRAYLRLGFRFLAWPAALAVAFTGLGSIWAGCYPLPDPRHAGPPVFVVALIAIPVLFA